MLFIVSRDPRKDHLRSKVIIVEAVDASEALRKAKFSPDRDYFKPDVQPVALGKEVFV